MSGGHSARTERAAQRSRFTAAEYREVTSGVAELMNCRDLHFAIKSAIAAVDEERWNITIPMGHPFWKVYDAYADKIVTALRQASPLQGLPLVES